MLRCVFVCLLLGFISSAPLSSDGDSWSASSSDEDSQLPAVFPVVGGALKQAPPSLIMKVMDTKSNITLSFAIFLLRAVQEEGSGTDGGRSDDSSEERTSQSIQPITSRFNSSEEMMSDQPMFTSDEDVDDFNNTFNRNDWNQMRRISDDFKDLSNTSIESEMNQKLRHLDESDEFNNGTESTKDRQSIVTLNSAPVSLEGFSLSHDGSLETGNFSREGSDSESLTSFSSESLGVTSHKIQNSAISNPTSRDQDVPPMTSSGPKDTISQIHSEGSPRFLTHVDAGLESQQSDDKKKVLGTTPNSLNVGQIGRSRSSSESDESLETFGFSGVGPDSQNLTSVSHDSEESPEATYDFHNGTGSGYSTQRVTGSKSTFNSESIVPVPDNKKAQDTPVMSVQADEAASLSLASLDQDIAPTILNIPKDTTSQVHIKGSTKFFSLVNVGLISDSSEESQEMDGARKVLGSTSSGPGLYRAGSPEVSSSSEEVLLALSSSNSHPAVPSPQTPIESESSESEELGILDSGPKLDFRKLDSSNESQSSELHPGPSSTFNLSLSLEFNPRSVTNFSSSLMISQEESEETLTTKTPNDASPTADSRTNTVSIASRSGVSMELHRGVKDASVDSSLETTTDSSHYVSTVKDLTTATLYTIIPVSAGASSNTYTDTGHGSSTEEEDLSKDPEGFALIIKPTASTMFTTHSPDSRNVNANANANVERDPTSSDDGTEAKTDANQHLGSEEKGASPAPPPPRRRKPYRYGFLGPISHSYSNQPVVRESEFNKRVASSQTHTRVKLASHHTREHAFYSSQHDQDRNHRPQTPSHLPIRKQTKIRLATVANLAQSSSEETK